MNEVKTQQKRKHDVILKSRKSLSIDGVEDVISFDEFQVVLITSCGEMTVEGAGLHISVLELDSGIVELDGNVEDLVKNYSGQHFAICYGDQSQKIEDLAKILNIKTVRV